jgi:hypothetical protein
MPFRDCSLVFHSITCLRKFKGIQTADTTKQPRITSRTHDGNGNIWVTSISSRNEKVVKFRPALLAASIPCLNVVILLIKRRYICIYYLSALASCFTIYLLATCYILPIDTRKKTLHCNLYICSEQQRLAKQKCF